MNRFMTEKLSTDLKSSLPQINRKQNKRKWTKKPRPKCFYMSSAKLYYINSCNKVEKERVSHFLRVPFVPRAGPKVYSIWETLFRKKGKCIHTSNKSRYWLGRRKTAQEITNFIKLEETTNSTTARKTALSLSLKHFWDHIVFGHLFVWQRFCTFIFYGKSRKVIQAFCRLCWLKRFLVIDSLETFFSLVNSLLEVMHFAGCYQSLGVSTTFLSHTSYVMQSTLHTLPLDLCVSRLISTPPVWFWWLVPEDRSEWRVLHDGSSYFLPRSKSTPEASPMQAQITVINHTGKWLQSPWTYSTE